MSAPIICAVCSKSADKSCSSCKSVWYCSIEHQKSDWKIHKKVCSPLELATSSQFGRHYVASRDLKAGTLILSELPVLVRPSRGQNVNLCLGCSTGCKGVCPECKWPICSEECSKSKLHAENECKIFKSNHIPYDISQANEIAMVAIYLIRGILLKNRDPETWSQLSKLQAKGQTIEIKNDEKFFKDMFQNAVRQFLAQITLPKYNSDDLDILQGVLKINGFVIEKYFDEKIYPTTVVSLYQKASLFANGCFPNCSKDFGCGPKFRIFVWTAVPVLKGQVLSISYSETGSLGSLKRQKIALTREGDFICHCPRCSDPSELGSNYSGLKCQLCQNGTLLPSSKSSNLEPKFWVCSICSKTQTNDIIEDLVQDLEKKVNEFTSLENVEEMRKFLASLLVQLHQNHWLIRKIIIKFQDQILKEINSSRGKSVCEEKVDFGISITRDLLKIIEFISPGLSSEKGDLLDRLYILKTCKFRIVEQGLSKLKDQNQNKMAELKVEASDLVQIISDLLDIKNLQMRCKMKGGLFERTIKNLETSLENFKRL